MPDQSLSNDAISGKTDQDASNPTDMTANSPTQATSESLESNVTRASEGEKQQADVTINKDPVISSGDVQTVGIEPGTASTSGGGDNYDDEEAWPYRKLQQEAKARQLDGSGKRDELVARLRESDASGGQPTEGGTPAHLQGVETTDGDLSATTSAPSASVDPEVVSNGGITVTDRGQDHAELLQGLSNERRAQQLASVRERSERSEA